MKKIYRWTEVRDGGECGGLFATFEEAFEAAKKHVAEMRLTERELKQLVTECANFVLVESAEVEDEDEYETADWQDDGYSVEINEATLGMIY